MKATVLFLADHEDDWRWLDVVDDAVAGRGEGVPSGDTPVVAVVPADAVALHWAELPVRSRAQAVAAARLLVAEASAEPIGELHVAVGREAGGEERPIGAVSNERMAGWLAGLAARAIDPVAILPAPMLLPRPEEGYVRADMGMGGAVRGPTSGFADEAWLTELIADGTEPETIGRDELEPAIVAAIAAPALDLRQGPFARRRKRRIDWRLIRRLAVLGGAILAVTLMIDLVRIAKFSFGADALGARADTLARTGLARSDAGAGDPDRLLGERLTRLRGPGEGFSRTAATVFAAVRDVGGSEVSQVTFEPNGDLRVGLLTDGEAQANMIRQRIEQAGFVVEASAFQQTGTRLTGELTVKTP